LDRETGRHPVIGLIDYGQVKTISTEERIALARVMQALAKDDRTKIIECMKDLGFRTRDMNEEVIYRSAQILFNRDDKEICEGYNFQQYGEVLSKRDPVTHMPEWIVMPVRLSILLRGLGTLLTPSTPVRTAEFWLPYSEQVLKEHA
jgi:aarF domain-containing kinase